MNTISKTLVLAILIAITTHTKAQVARASRPDLFSAFSEKISASISELDKAFVVNEGSSIQLKFTDAFSFTGTVSSSIKRYNNLSSVIIKSPSLYNSLLSISKRINDDNSITYVGRIINEKYADGYELKKDNSGNYSFNKIRTTDLLQDY
jgi:uncharacterized protein YdeI (BOF family)